MINLSTYLYFIGSKQELMGIRQDISEALHSERYNIAFSQATGTISDKNCQAESATKEEAIIKLIYSRVYKTMKNKYDSTEKILDSVKKITTLRIKEYELGVKA